MAHTDTLNKPHADAEIMLFRAFLDEDAPGMRNLLGTLLDVDESVLDDEPSSSPDFLLELDSISA